MAAETDRSTNVGARIKTRKAAWDMAPGPKKDAVQEHSTAAEWAHRAKNDADTNKALCASTDALARGDGPPARPRDP